MVLTAHSELFWEYSLDGLRRSLDADGYPFRSGYPERCAISDRHKVIATCNPYLRETLTTPVSVKSRTALLKNLSPFFCSDFLWALCMGVSKLCQSSSSLSLNLSSEIFLWCCSGWKSLRNLQLASWSSPTSIGFLLILSMKATTRVSQAFKALVRNSE